MKDVEKSRVKKIAQLHGEITTLQEEIGGAMKRSLKTAISIGELLEEQKSMLEHGAFIPWIEQNLPFDVRTGQRYMRAWKNREKLKNDSVSHLTGAYRMLEEPVKVRKGTGKRERKVLPLVSDKENGHPRPVIDSAPAVEEKPKNHPRVTSYQSERFRAISKLKRTDLGDILSPIIRQIENGYREILKHTENNPASVIELTRQMMKVRDLFGSWTRSHSKPCPRCEGTGEVTRDDPEGKPVTIDCKYCLEGQVGDLVLAPDNKVKFRTRPPGT